MQIAILSSNLGQMKELNSTRELLKFQLTKVKQRDLDIVGINQIYGTKTN